MAQAHSEPTEPAAPASFTSGGGGITPILKYRPRHPAARRYWFWRVPPTAEALDEIAQLGPAERPQNLMLCGHAARLTRAHIRTAEAAGWTVTGYRSRLGSATLERRGVTLDIRGSAVWFGPVADTELIRTAWYLLAAALRATFGPSAYLWPTPTLTGQELMRSVLPSHCEYPVLPPEPLQLLAGVGQGRVELFTAPGGVNASLERAEGAVLLDARFAYAHHLHNLPAGAVADEIYPEPGVILLDARRDVGYAPSFWRFVAKAPHDWRHIGLLPYRPADGGRLEFPHEPGAEFSGWASGAEIFLAVDQGWHVVARQKIHWPWTGRNDPAGTFVRRMVALRDEYAHRAEVRHDAPAALVAYAARAIVMGTIGSWNRVRDTQEGFTPYSDPGGIPAGAFPLPAPDADGWEWKRTLPRVTEWSHPEWAQTVYGRTRAAGAKLLLSLPVDALLAYRTDGAWLARPVPSANLPADQGRPGGWRVKATYAVAAGFAPPRTEAEMLALIHTAFGGPVGASAVYGEPDGEGE